MSESTIRILIVDDHEIVRQSLLALLAREPDMDVVAVGANGREAIALAQETEPDVIVMDVSMPELDGISAAGEIQALGLDGDIIMLSMHMNTVLLEQARHNGASGYIAKQKANRELVPAIRAAYAGSLSL